MLICCYPGILDADLPRYEGDGSVRIYVSYLLVGPTHGVMHHHLLPVSVLLNQVNWSACRQRQGLALSLWLSQMQLHQPKRRKLCMDACLGKTPLMLCTTVSSSWRSKCTANPPSIVQSKSALARETQQQSVWLSNQQCCKDSMISASSSVLYMYASATRV